MIKEEYLKQIKQKIEQFNKGKDLKFFIYGSSLTREHFGDIDLGVLGDITEDGLIELKENFKKSALPYFIDVINFNKVSEEFKKNVFNNKILWIIR